MDLAEIERRLKEPFPVSEVHWRVGSKSGSRILPLAYIDARAVMKRLDAVVGFTNWQVRYPFPGCCEIGIRIEDEWIWKANCAGETNVEAEKGQASDAFKRAAAVWGVGRYLYYLPHTWVTVNNGKWNPPPLPKWAIPREDK